jgi:hypothetical protein
LFFKTFSFWRTVVFWPFFVKITAQATSPLVLGEQCGKAAAYRALD